MIPGNSHILTPLVHALLGCKDIFTSVLETKEDNPAGNYVANFRDPIPIEEITYGTNLEDCEPW